MSTGFLSNAIRQFNYYKLLGDRCLEQLNEAQLFYQPDENSNSIAVIVKHLHGNMLSRWSDFLTSDGEKEWRNRDAEFENEQLSRDAVIALWNAGWECVFGALNQLKEDDLQKTVYIRNQGHSVEDAIVRQLAHYPYHIGQIVFISRILAADKWKSLSIPKNQSKQFNADKFAQPKHMGHFSDDALKKKE